MKFWVFFLFPFYTFAQPKKATLYGRKISLPIHDSLIVWNADKEFSGQVFIGEKLLTIHKEQFSIDSFSHFTTPTGMVYLYFLSRRGKNYRCFIYPSSKTYEWEMLFDNNSTLIVYKMYE